MITPTEYGTSADVQGVAELCHTRHPVAGRRSVGRSLRRPPRSADRRRAGWCYIAIQSLLKAGGGLCQASMILVGGDRVDPVDLRLRLDLIITTSPSPLMCGSIDSWRGHLALNGKLIDGALERVARIHRRLKQVAGLEVMGEPSTKPRANGIR